MTRYALKNQNDEVINTVPANDLNEAKKYFAKIKRLPIDKLLEIYKVDIFIR